MTGWCMTDPKKIMFFSNGATAVFNEKGEQIPELQRPWLLIFREFLATAGVNFPETLEVILPSGKSAEFFLAVDPDTGEQRWNWKIL